MEVWIIAAQIICLAAAIGLLGMVYEMDSETPQPVRYGMLTLAVAFFAVFLFTFRNHVSYEFASAVAFTGLGVMVIAFVAYRIVTKKAQPIVVKISGASLAIISLVWLVANCTDLRRQKDQIETVSEATAPTASTVTIGDSTQKAINRFDSLSKK